MVGRHKKPIKDVMHCYSGDVVGSFTVTSSASPSTSSKFCTMSVTPGYYRVAWFPWYQLNMVTMVQ